MVVVGLLALGGHAVAQVVAVDHVVAADEAGQVEGLARRVERDGALAGVGRDGLRGDVHHAGAHDVGPDLVRDDHAVVGAVDLHGALDLPALPHAAAGVVRRAEDHGVDALLLDAALHVVEVHAPDTVLVAHERRVHDSEAVVLERVREAHVGGAVHEHGVAGRGKGRERRDHAAEHAVLVADVARSLTPLRMRCQSMMAW